MKILSAGSDRFKVYKKGIAEMRISFSYPFLFVISGDLNRIPGTWPQGCEDNKRQLSNHRTWSRAFSYFLFRLC